MRTIVYIDGYNLYYSLLKHSAFKWLDLYSLFNHQILHSQDPATELLCIKYYTADIKAKFASKGVKATESQQRYLRALQFGYSGPVKVIKGYYIDSRATPMRYKKPPDKTDRVEAWNLEEKQTDVNIALDLYRDVVRANCEQIVVCTNDTDIAPALSYIRTDFPNMRIGLVCPRLAKNAGRPIAKDLVNCAHWVRRHINENELSRSLFSNRVATSKKPVDKPDYW